MQIKEYISNAQKMWFLSEKDGKTYASNDKKKLEEFIACGYTQFAIKLPDRPGGWYMILDKNMEASTTKKAKTLENLIEDIKKICDNYGTTQ